MKTNKARLELENLETGLEEEVEREGETFIESGPGRSCWFKRQE